MRTTTAVAAASVLAAAAPFLLALRFASPPPPSDACLLLSASQINGIMGVDMGSSRHMLGKTCQWRQPVKPGKAGAILNLAILSPSFFEAGKSALYGRQMSVAPVSGLGEQAYYLQSANGAMTLLRVRKSSGAFEVRVWGTGVPEKDVKPKDMALAKLIVTEF